MTDNGSTDNDATGISDGEYKASEASTRNNARYSSWYKRDFRSFSCSHLVLDHLIALEQSPS